MFIKIFKKLIFIYYFWNKTNFLGQKRGEDISVLKILGVIF